MAPGGGRELPMLAAARGRGSAMTSEDIEAAAKRVYAVIPVMIQVRVPSTATNVLYTKEWKGEPWEDTDEDYRNHCRRIAAAALNVEEKP